jgi:hypothetical protein
MYPLRLTKANTVSRQKIGSYEVVILTNCQGGGVVQYAHAAVVYSADSQYPIFAVASEVNARAEEISGGSHFFCTYDDRHNNYGCSDDWGDLEKFTQAALRTITNRFNVSDADHL